MVEGDLLDRNMVGVEIFDMGRDLQWMGNNRGPAGDRRGIFFDFMRISIKGLIFSNKLRLIEVVVFHRGKNYKYTKLK